MKGLAVPEPTEDFTADPVELFFDLAFVFAFSQLVHLLIVHPDWQHVGEAALLFVLLWLPWTQFTWSANGCPATAGRRPNTSGSRCVRTRSGRRFTTHTTDRAHSAPLVDRHRRSDPIGWMRRSIVTLVATCLVTVSCSSTAAMTLLRASRW